MVLVVMNANQYILVVMKVMVLLVMTTTMVPTLLLLSFDGSPSYCCP